MSKLDEYLNQIELALVSSPIVSTYKVTRRWANTDDGYIRLEIQLVNHDLMEAAEYFVLENDQIQTEDYRFHWMDQNKQLRRRWDNAPHHPEVATFPHHIHDETGNIIPGQTMSIFDLLTLLENDLPNPSS
ncbi:MAG: hypothetical protein HF973_02520 [Chloroflexi bacterium]|nr:hypothetical protein [Chloroflexota bacterium]